MKLTPRATRLEQLLDLRDRVDEEIRRERARQARLNELTRRLPVDLELHPLLIIDAVCADFRITPVDLLGRRRQPHFSEARHVAAWIARDIGLPPRDAAALLETTATHIPYRVRRCEEQPHLLQRAIAIRDRAIAGEVLG